MARIDDLRLARNKTLQKFNLLIIDVFQVLRTEKALGHADFICENKLILLAPFEQLIKSSTPLDTQPGQKGASVLNEERNCIVVK